MHLFEKRQGQMFADQLYFYTDTIIGFEHLLADDDLKLTIINSLKYLKDKNLIKIYGYVIMPNHIHLIWSILQMNGKESPQGSFSKFCGHEFKKHLLKNDPDLLTKFISKLNDRSYQFWKRDPLAIPISSEEIFWQKLDYIHYNPVNEKWQLCQFPEMYRWSSASFYLNGYDEFNLLTHFKD